MIFQYLIVPKSLRVADTCLKIFICFYAICTFYLYRTIIFLNFHCSIVMITLVYRNFENIWNYREIVCELNVYTCFKKLISFLRFSTSDIFPSD
uniref:Secreted protein n=1 Tax=Heterorhabditis bacteriophora TaxID=37862 RepID=A0A1I7WHX8_HETBA